MRGLCAGAGSSACNRCTIPFNGDHRFDGPPKDLTKYAACGLVQQSQIGPTGSGLNFINWDGSINSVSPEVYPRTEQDLRWILQTLKANGCSPRPAGTGHSAAGLVVQSNNRTEVAISLAMYQPTGVWNGTFDAAKQTYKMSAGMPSGPTCDEPFATVNPDQPRARGTTHRRRDVPGPLCPEPSRRLLPADADRWLVLLPRWHHCQLGARRRL
jgi:hypothetical protein